FRIPSALCTQLWTKRAHNDQNSEHATQASYCFPSRAVRALRTRRARALPVSDAMASRTRGTWCVFGRCETARRTRIANGDTELTPGAFWAHEELRKL